MLSDFLCTIVFLGFFGVLIYSTILRQKSRAAGHAFSGSGEALREARTSATRPTPSPSRFTKIICELPRMVFRVA